MIAMMTEQLNKPEIIVNSQSSLDWFGLNITNLSYERFIEGNHVSATLRFLQNHKKTMRISAKDHFKSSSLYTHFLWLLFTQRNVNREYHYFSYQESMAGYHLSKIKSMIERNPYFKEIRDLKSMSDSVIKYTWDNEHIISLVPHGLLAFKRGIHCHGVYVDDPFQDPENKLNLTVINKINRVFVEQIMDMPFQDGFLHVVGTPQSTNDFFFNKKITTRFKVLILPAIQSEKTKKVLWQEYMNYDELVFRREERGNKSFNQEYLCTPVYVEEAWFSRQDLDPIIDPKLEILKRYKKTDTEEVYLGWDLGKKQHPSHVAIFVVRDKKAYQIYEKWFDGVDYTDQLKEVNDLMILYDVSKGYFDNTRGELESFIEQDRIHHALEPVTFGTKSKHEMATNFEALVNNKRIALLDKRRMLEQILLVTNDLQSASTPEGHGDSFWSIALALKCMIKSEMFLGVKTDSGIEDLFPEEKRKEDYEQ